mgnify:CR=1 FL=1
MISAERPPVRAESLAAVALCGQEAGPRAQAVVCWLCRIVVRNQPLARAFLALLWKQRVLEFARDDTPARMMALLAIR